MSDGTHQFVVVTVAATISRGIPSARPRVSAPARNAVAAMASSTTGLEDDAARHSSEAERRGEAQADAQLLALAIAESAVALHRQVAAHPMRDSSHDHRRRANSEMLVTPYFCVALSA